MFIVIQQLGLSQSTSLTRFSMLAFHSVSILTMFLNAFFNLLFSLKQNKTSASTWNYIVATFGCWKVLVIIFKVQLLNSVANTRIISWGERLLCFVQTRHFREMSLQFADDFELFAHSNEIENLRKPVLNSKLCGVQFLLNFMFF